MNPPSQTGLFAHYGFAALSALTFFLGYWHALAMALFGVFQLALAIYFLLRVPQSDPGNRGRITIYFILVGFIFITWYMLFTEGSGTRGFNSFMLLGAPWIPALLLIHIHHRLVYPYHAQDIVEEEEPDLFDEEF